MNQDKIMSKKRLSLVPSKRALLREQCIPQTTEEEAQRQLEEYVKTYDPAMASIQYRITHVPSKGILKRSSYCQRAVEIVIPESTDEEEPPHLFPTVKDSLEILLKKKSSICARKSILKKPSRTDSLTNLSPTDDTSSNLFSAKNLSSASTVYFQHTSDDDESCPLAKFPARDSMEMLINRSKSCIKMSEARDEKKVKSGEKKTRQEKA